MMHPLRILARLIGREHKPSHATSVSDMPKQLRDVLDGDDDEDQRLLEEKERLFIDPHIGWRAFDLIESYEQPLLVSPFAPGPRTPWPHRQKVRAVCLHDALERRTCCCGINAFETRKQLRKRGYDQLPIIAEVALWGEVHSYDLGHRGQWAYPLRLLIDERRVTPQQAEQLADAYGIPVVARSERELEHIQLDDDAQLPSLIASLVSCGCALTLMPFLWAFWTVLGRRHDHVVAAPLAAWRAPQKLPAITSSSWMHEAAIASIPAFVALVALALWWHARRMNFIPATAALLATALIGLVGALALTASATGSAAGLDTEALFAQAALVGPYTLSSDKESALGAVSDPFSGASEQLASCLEHTPEKAQPDTSNCELHPVTDQQLAMTAYDLQLTRPGSCATRTWHPNDEQLLVMVEHELMRKDMPLTQAAIDQTRQMGIEIEICRRADTLSLSPRGGLGYSVAVATP